MGLTPLSNPSALLGEQHASLWQINPFNLIAKRSERASSTTPWREAANELDLSYKHQEAVSPQRPCSSLPVLTFVQGQDNF